MRLKVPYSQKLLTPGKALYFDGTDDWAGTSTYLDTYSQTFEVRAIAKPNNNGCIFNGRWGWTEGKFNLYPDGFRVGGFTQRGLAPIDGRWHTYRLFHDPGTTLVVFEIDGETVWSGSAGVGPIGFFTGVAAGMNFGVEGEYLSGAIDRLEVRRGGETVALWPIEEGEGETTADVVGPYDLTIYGATWGDGRPPVPVFYRSLTVSTLKRSIKLEVIG